MKRKPLFIIQFVLVAVLAFGHLAAAQVSVSAPAPSPAVSKDAVMGVIGRIIPSHAASFDVELIPTDKGRDVFEFESAGGKIVLRGSSQSSILAGLNWYLKYYANVHISWTGDQLNLPATLPPVPRKVRIVSPFKYRYIYNYCTFNYTMSFWTWKEWERELDFLALNGVNLALGSVVGQEALWQNFMRKLGFTEKEIFDFIPGPAFEAWWLMDNLEGWGGPVTQQWIDARAELQKKILARMHELGIEPVMQGFFGMMPRAAMTHFPDAGIIETGIWGREFKRPPMLLPYKPLFKKAAKLWYDEQRSLYGDARFFGGDPFHEGEIQNVNLQKVGTGIQNAMMEARPDSIWVLQGWMANPNPLIISRTKKSNVLILDLFGESNPEWKVPNRFRGFPWAWCIISNFGGKTGMHGNLGTVANDPIDAQANDPSKGTLVGLGAMMEGSGMNAPLWDLLFEMAWRDKKPDLDEWIVKFASRRYGKTTPGVEKAWKLLKDSVYQGNRLTGEFDSRSLFVTRPSMTSRRDSNLGTSAGPYDACKFRAAWKLLINEADNFRGIKTYEYDLVDSTREYMSNAAPIIQQRISIAYSSKNKESFKKYTDMFLQMIDDEDRLLGADQHFMLGKWIDDAKAWGKTDDEKKLFEWNARTVITTWAGRVGAEGLDDYASREWNGTLRTYYHSRWKTLFEDLAARMDGATPPTIDWYGLQEPWSRDIGDFASTPSGDPINEAKAIYDKYSKILNQSCGSR